MDRHNPLPQSGRDPQFDPGRAHFLYGGSMFGLFGGKKLSVKLDKTEFKPGEEISGIIKLETKSPLPADRLRVALSYNAPDKTYTTPIETEFVSTEIQGSSEFVSGEFHFSISIPAIAPEIEYPGDDPQMADAWKNDDVLGANSFFVLAFLEFPKDKPLKSKYADIKIHYNE